MTAERKAGSWGAAGSSETFRNNLPGECPFCCVPSYHWWPSSSVPALVLFCFVFDAEKTPCELAEPQTPFLGGEPIYQGHPSPAQSHRCQDTSRQSTGPALWKHPSGNARGHRSRVTSGQRYPRGIKRPKGPGTLCPPARHPEPIREQRGRSHSAFLLPSILGPWAPHTPAQICTWGRGPPTHGVSLGGLHIAASGLERRLWGRWAGHCLWVARHCCGHTKRRVIEASLARGLQAV